MAVIDRIGAVIGELQTWSFAVPLSVVDPLAVNGSRPPLLTEIDALELTVCLVESNVGTPITAWTYSAGTWDEGAEVLENLDIKNVGRGVYDETTGILTVTLHAGDNPCVGTGTSTGMKETHEATVTCRYNGDTDQFPKVVSFRVQNLNKVPREP